MAGDGAGAPDRVPGHGKAASGGVPCSQSCGFEGTDDSGFRHTRGIEPKDLLLQKRMEQAAILLKNTNLSIHNVMLGCGLANETYFYKKFKEHFNLSPQQYRKENKQV